jgi:hypothetical protein
LTLAELQPKIDNDMTTHAFTALVVYERDEGFAFECQFGELSVSGEGTLEHAVVIIESVTVASAAPGGLTTTAFRSVPLGELRADVFRELLAVGRHVVLVDEPGEAQQEGATPPGPGRPALADAWYRRVAESYLRALEEGAESPVTAVRAELAEHLDRPDLSRATVAGWIRKARKGGWLSAAIPGRAGAEPGPRLLEARRKENE